MPNIAVLLDSLEPEVNITSFALTPSISATDEVIRAISALACLPGVWSEFAFPG